jgi:hypothetical protein
MYVVRPFTSHGAAATLFICMSMQALMDVFMFDDTSSMKPK